MNAAHTGISPSADTCNEFRKSISTLFLRNLHLQFGDSLAQKWLYLIQCTLSSLSVNLPLCFCHLPPGQAWDHRKLRIDVSGILLRWALPDYRKRKPPPPQIPMFCPPPLSMLTKQHLACGVMSHVIVSKKVLYIMGGTAHWYACKACAL